MTSSCKQYPPFQMTYRRLNQLGEGSFGKVYLAEKLEEPQSENKDKSNSINMSNNTSQGKLNHKQYFAVKSLKPNIRKKYDSPPINYIQEYPEVSIMQQLLHSNILQLKQIVQFDKGYAMSHYLVLDFGIELLEFSKHKEISLSSEQTRYLIKQLAEAIFYLHSQGVMHRDIKPDNIYLMRDGTLKLGDFSISTHSKSAPMQESSNQENSKHTSNVTTRHYRAPEIIYGSRNYDQSIDIWSFGCTLGELLLGSTLFPGTTDIHQLELIFSMLGCPQDLWPQAEKLPYYLEFDNSKPPTGLERVILTSPELLDLLQRSLRLNPAERITAAGILEHPYLKADYSSTALELGKMCGYLHQKKLRELLKGKK